MQKKTQIGREAHVLSRNTLKEIDRVHTEVREDHQEGRDREKEARDLEGQDQGRDRKDQAGQGEPKEEGPGLKVGLPHQNQDEKSQSQLIQRKGRRLRKGQRRQEMRLTSPLKETSKGTSYLYYYYVITIYYYRFFNINVKFKIRIFLYLKLLHFHSNFEKLIQ